METPEKSVMQLKEPPINRATIEAVAQLIAEQFDPLQVILFGSHRTRQRRLPQRHRPARRPGLLGRLAQRRQSNSTSDWRRIHSAG